MAAIAAAAITAGAGILGDLFSHSGQQSTNAANLQIAQSQEAFQAQQTSQVEGWEAGQAATAMQTRVKDYELAGLNPMLAAGGPGATAMSVSPPSGAAIPMQNPNASFQNMAQVMASAAQSASSASQVGVNAAQADAFTAKASLDRATAAKTGGPDTAMVGQQMQESQNRINLMNAQADAAKAQAASSRQDVVESGSRISKINADIAALGHVNSMNDAIAALRGLDFDMRDLEINQFALISPELVKQAIATANSSSIQAGMLAKAFQTYQGGTGTTFAYLDRISNWLHLGANLSQFAK